jgi:hypothetical protein
MAKLRDNQKEIDSFEEQEIRNQNKKEEADPLKYSVDDKTEMDGKTLDDELIEHKGGTWIDLNGHTLDVQHIHRMKKTERYNDFRGKMMYGILINEEPLPMKEAFYLNTLINFNSEEHRDRVYNGMKEAFKTIKNVEFI